MTSEQVISTAIESLQRICVARDFMAENGFYPFPPDGPDEDQEFDDWAADVAENTLKLIASYINENR
jgi:hypothetical protein